MSVSAGGASGAKSAPPWRGNGWLLPCSEGRSNTPREFVCVSEIHTDLAQNEEKPWHLLLKLWNYSFPVVIVLFSEQTFGEHCSVPGAEDKETHQTSGAVRTVRVPSVVPLPAATATNRSPGNAPLKHGARNGSELRYHDGPCFSAPSRLALNHADGRDSVLQMAAASKSGVIVLLWEAPSQRILVIKLPTPSLPPAKV